MPLVSFHVPKAWAEALKQYAAKKGGVGRVVREAVQLLIARYKQPELLPGRPVVGAGGGALPAEPERRRRRRSTPAGRQECGRCCQLAAEAEKWFKRYLEHLVERAKGEKGRIFSVVVTRDIRRLFGVDVCPQLAAYFTARLLETGCVNEVHVRGSKSAGRHGRRLVLDSQCVKALQAKHL